MNTDRLKTLVNTYIGKYPELTAGDRDVRHKWEAVANCVRTWDLDAVDFGNMFAQATEDASSMIEDGAVNPREGILYLCNHGRSSQVRDAFSDLLVREGSEISERQAKAQRFVTTINQLLTDEAPEEWQYRQKMRTAIRYLALIHPEDNYFFRASEATAFAGYTEVDDEIGYDRSFSLQNYYRMCDDTAAYIDTRQDLLKTVNKGLQQKAKQTGDSDLVGIDPQHHILVYDLISSAYQRDFYSEKAANRKSKISAVAQRKLGRTRQRAHLLDVRETVVDELDQVKSDQAAEKIPSLVDSRASHQAYGEGTVTEQNGKYLTVTFQDSTKKFALPGAVVNGYLTFDSDKIMQTCKDMEKSQTKRREVENKLNSVDVQLSMLE